MLNVLSRVRPLEYHNLESKISRVLSRIRRDIEGDLLRVSSRVRDHVSWFHLVQDLFLEILR